MPTLADSLLAEPRAEALATECSRMIDEHVEQIKGLRGMGLRTAMGMLKAGRPDAGSGAMGRLLPDFVKALEPYYQEFLGASGKDFGAFLVSKGDTINAALLGAIDARVERSPNATLKSMYPKFRSAIEAEMAGITPKIAAIIARHVTA